MKAFKEEVPESLMVCPLVHLDAGLDYARNIGNSAKVPDDSNLHRLRYHGSFTERMA